MPPPPALCRIVEPGETNETSDIYLDTNAFRYFGIAFEHVLLASEITEKILVSPLSLFEVFAQLGDDNPANADLVLRQIHAVRNWTNPNHAVLLPWPDVMLQMVWSQNPVQDDDFRERMQQSFNVILTADSLTPLKEAALQQKQMMDDFKNTMAYDFKNMLDDLKKQQGKKKGRKQNQLIRPSHGSTELQNEQKLVLALRRSQKFSHCLARTTNLSNQNFRRLFSSQNTIRSATKIRTTLSIQNN